ncbi:MAG: hypothetical protein LBH44_03040 [Treponema sp.]|jgi:hypothetical protein|nr:hypothetical protein [Treponema sp.]
MGNHDFGAVGFRQSVNDFPCSVELGNASPSFGIKRFGKALRFCPTDDEGFSLRGDKQRLLYKGRRRSHRFTIHNDTAFEYDCILNREPDSNVITLLIDGAEHFDFFRQPDFVSDPFLKGSYAVYKKDTLLGDGTGKLCHIHRPEIIDAKDRRCWGDLAVVDNVLRITVPDWFLSDAKYPVIVDPTVGTSTVGSQNKHIWEPGEPAEPLMFELSIPVNRFLVPETINGLCTAYAYVNQDDWEAGGRPVIYSDNGDKPLTRKSMEEGFIDLRVVSGKPVGWRSATFKSNGSIASGSYIWFGVFCEYYWMPRFDYGAKCYVDWWDAYTSIPNTYPLYSANYYENFKLSMYFTYTSAQNYIRTITQGVFLSDSRKLTANYKRQITQTVQANSALSRLQTLYRKFQEAVKVSDHYSASVQFLRIGNDHIKVTDTFNHWGAFFRGLFENPIVTDDARAGWILSVKIADTVHAAGTVFRGLILLVRIVTGVFIRDYLLGRFLKAKQELVLKSAITREIILESKID